MSNIFKNSSVITIWNVNTESGEHVVELNDNELTGRRCFNIDHEEVLCDTSFLFSKAFDYTFEIDGHTCEISVRYMPSAHYAQTVTGHFKMDGEEIEPAAISHE